MFFGEFNVYNVAALLLHVLLCLTSTTQTLLTVITLFVCTYPLSSVFYILFNCFFFTECENTEVRDMFVNVAKHEVSH